MMRPRRRLPHTAALLAAFCLAQSGCAFVSADVSLFGGGSRPPLDEEVVEGKGDDKIVLVDVSRLISEEPSEQSFGLRERESVLARTTAELRRAAEDDDVKAVVVRINSPGGTVTASDTLYHEILRLKEKRPVPVIAQLMGTATSGGYYVALAADEIVAHPTTVTGSVGVILANLSLAGLMQMVGIKDQTLTAGRYKDIGTPLRDMRPDEREILQSVLDDMRARFVTLVRERRPKVAADSTATDGRVLTADQALVAGLVDQIGYLDDTLSLARERAGVSEASVVMYRRPAEMAENIYSLGSTPSPQVNLINLDFGFAARGPQFLYLWTPAHAP